MRFVRVSREKRGGSVSRFWWERAIAADAVLLAAMTVPAALWASLDVGSEALQWSSIACALWGAAMCGVTARVKDLLQVPSRLSDKMRSRDMVNVRAAMLEAITWGSCAPLIAAAMCAFSAATTAVPAWVAALLVAVAVSASLRSTVIWVLSERLSRKPTDYTDSVPS